MKTEYFADNDDGGACCSRCGRDPCLWFRHGENVLESCRNSEHLWGGDITNKQRRFFCYREFTRIFHGILSSGDRRKLPECVEENIRECFPNLNGEAITGFKQA